MDELRRGALHFLPVRGGFDDRAKKKMRALGEQTGHVRNLEHARVFGERRIYGS
jgi:hypothetical protein